VILDSWRLARAAGLAFIAAQLFSARPSHLELDGRAQIPDARAERAAGVTETGGSVSCSLAEPGAVASRVLKKG